jgi:hypothetical protein
VSHSDPTSRHITPAASAAEAAAIVAAIARFVHDTAPLQASPQPTQDPWLRAAMLEGASLEDWGAVSDPWLNT